MTGPALHCAFERVAWSRETDGADIPAHAGTVPATVRVTRAGVAAIVAKDSSEISADEALGVLRAHSALIARVAQACFDREPGPTVTIDYDDIERAL